MLEANRLILDDLDERIEGELIDSRVEGRVVIEAGARLERSDRPRAGDHRRRRADRRRLHRPVHRDRRGRARSSAPRSSTRSCSPAPRSRDLEGRIEASLIGRNVTLERADALPKAYRFVVGDNAEIRLTDGRQ